MKFFRWLFPASTAAAQGSRLFWLQRLGRTRDDYYND